MVREREPILMCATGKKGVGKTYQTEKLINDYIKPNRGTGKKGRKVLIYDINMEYTRYKVIGLKDIKKFSRQNKIEIRRVLPINEDGSVATLVEMVDILNTIIQTFRGGLLVLEDINRYMIQARTTEVVGLLATNRHRDLDIICHFQSLAPLDPRMWQNTAMVRFHYQLDDVKRYKNRIPNYELFALAQCLVENKYLKEGNKRFFCWVSSDENFITGNFTEIDFNKAVVEYCEKYPRKVTDVAKRYGTGLEGRKKAMTHITKEFKMKYFKR